MTTQVKMWTMEGNYDMPRYKNKLMAFKEETYPLLKVRLEGKSALEWTFEFGDNDNKCRIWQKNGGFNEQCVYLAAM